MTPESGRPDEYSADGGKPPMGVAVKGNGEESSTLPSHKTECACTNGEFSDASEGKLLDRHGCTVCTGTGIKGRSGYAPKNGSECSSREK